MTRQAVVERFPVPAFLAELRRRSLAHYVAFAAFFETAEPWEDGDGVALHVDLKGFAAHVDRGLVGDAARAVGARVDWCPCDARPTPRRGPRR